MSAAASADDLLPRPAGGHVPGVMLALIAHAALLAALAAGVEWRARTPTVVSAELWAAVPQTAAPRPPAPAPAPPPPPPPPVAVPVLAPPPPKPAAAEPDAQIAIERAARERQERERAERERAQREKAAQEKSARDKAASEKAEREKLERVKAEQAQKLKAEREKAEHLKAERELAAKLVKEKAQQVADEARLVKLREENLRRIQSQAEGAGSPTSTGSAAQDAAPSAGYAGRLIARIKPNIVLTEALPPTLEADVEVRALPGGGIIARRIVKSSGNPLWDEAVLRAIDRTATLPRDVDGRVPGTLVITFRP